MLYELNYENMFDEQFAAQFEDLGTAIQEARKLCNLDGGYDSSIYWWWTITLDGKIVEQCDANTLSHLQVIAYNEDDIYY